MSTKYVQFTPSQSSNFTFQPTFDGSACTVVVTWGLFGQRYYVNIYAPDGSLVLAMPLIGSPPDVDISMTAGYFDTKLIWRPSTGNFEVIS